MKIRNVKIFHSKRQPWVFCGQITYGASVLLVVVIEELLCNFITFIALCLNKSVVKLC